MVPFEATSISVLDPPEIVWTSSKAVILSADVERNKAPRLVEYHNLLSIGFISKSIGLCLVAVPSISVSILEKFTPPSVDFHNPIF